MTKLSEVKRAELVWAGKYDPDGSLKPVDRTILPFQTVETVNESKADREKAQRDLFTKQAQDQTWRNQLVWGDNKIIMSSLLPKFAGKINLIYIDPPFATGQDFSFRVRVGDEEFMKEPSIIEDKAYRDTWGRGLDSYLQMMFERLSLMRELLAEDGSIYVHIGPDVSHYVRGIMDEVFGAQSCINEIIWKRTDAHSNVTKKYGTVHDTLLFYSKTLNYFININAERDELSESALKEYSLVKTPKGHIKNYEPGVEGRRFKLDDVTVPGMRQVYHFTWRGAKPSPNRSWPVDKATLEKWLEDGKLYLRNPDIGAARCKVSFLDENEGILSQDLWINVGRMKGGSTYSTEKPEKLLERIIKISSRENDLIADFFCGSGTTLAVAEKLGRRWMGSDLSKWAIQVTRKRMLQIEGCKPFELLNLGNYERHKLAKNGHLSADKNVCAPSREVSGPSREERSSFERYVKFILELYRAEEVSGFKMAHGKKGRAYVHVGSVDSPVTMREIRETLKEVQVCADKNVAPSAQAGETPPKRFVLREGGMPAPLQEKSAPLQEARVRELHFLGWDFEMGLHDLVNEVGEEYGVRVRLVSIPKEALEVSNPAKEEVRFFDLNYLAVEVLSGAQARMPAPLQEKKVTVKLKDFIIANPEYLPEEVRDKIKKFSDYIDYWAVDWDYQGDTFHNGWQSFRTRKEPKLETSASYAYGSTDKNVCGPSRDAKKKILVKVVDIFGNDTTKMIEVKI